MRRLLIGDVELSILATNYVCIGEIYEVKIYRETNEHGNQIAYYNILEKKFFNVEKIALWGVIFFNKESLQKTINVE